MKTEKWRFRTPYSFRARLAGMLLAASILACVASLLLSFFLSQADVRTEKARSELNLAQVMLRLDAADRMRMDELIGIVQAEGFSVLQVPEEVLSQFSGEELQALRAQSVSAFTTPDGKPVTYAVLRDGMVMIAPDAGFSVYPVVFWRLLSVSLSFLAVFLLATLLVSVRVSQPITALTDATRKVTGGDFSVKLPETVSGEVGELMQSFNRMTEALDRNAWLQKDFIANVSHEFKTPIATIRGYTELLQMPGISPEQRQEFLAALASESERLSRLSQTLLRLSALEKQAASAEKSVIQLDEQLRQTILRMEPVWSRRNIEWDLQIGPARIRSDADLLGQVWTNLLDNAIKFSPEGSVIRVQLTAGADGVRVTIADRGIGMDAETVSRIFDAFYQADRSRSQGGVGLGLSLVRRILDLLGGTIDVQSEKGKGSAFTVHLAGQTEP